MSNQDHLVLAHIVHFQGNNGIFAQSPATGWSREWPSPLENFETLSFKIHACITTKHLTLLAPQETFAFVSPQTPVLPNGSALGNNTKSNGLKIHQVLTAIIILVGLL